MSTIPPRTTAALFGCLLAAALFWAYWPALDGGWVWDDTAEVVQNADLRDPAGLLNVWIAPSGYDYLPVKASVQWIEWNLWGDWTMGYHLVSLALHFGAALLFWRLLHRIGLGLAWLGAAIFALHPLAVESVAWISELKNTLSMAFVLAAMVVYEREDLRLGKEEGAGGWRPPRSRRYALSLGLFVLAMLSKQSVAMAPFLILGLAWWRRGKVRRRDLAAAAPFFAVALLLGIVAIAFQQSRAIAGGNLEIPGLGGRIAGCARVLVFYAQKFIWPADLTPIYPKWTWPAPFADWAWPWAAIAAALGCAAWAAARGRRGPAFCMGAYLAALLPVLGWIPMSFLMFSWVSDHLGYLSILALSGGLTAACASIAPRLGQAGWRAGLALAAAVLTVLAFQSRGQAAAYSGNEAFWTLAQRNNPGAWVADNELGRIYSDQGRLGDAIALLGATVRSNPGYAEGRCNLANALARCRRYDEAIDEYRRALNIKAELSGARSGLGNALLSAGRVPEALVELTAAAKAQPDFAEIRNNLGVALLQSNRVPEAIEQFRRALALKPGYADAARNLAGVLNYLGREDEARTVMGGIR